MDLGSLLDRLTGRLKVVQAAILDMEGEVVQVTAGWKLSPEDGAALRNVLLAAPTRGLWRLKLLGDDFHCFHCDSRSSVLGRSGGAVLVAHATRRHLVVGVAPQCQPGSCLYEMKQVWAELEARGL